MKSIHHQRSVSTLHAALLLFLVSALSALAQGKFKTGDRVECDWLQNGSFDKGTVVPFTKTDLDQSGRWYRVRLDKDTIPNSTTECMTVRMRLLVEKAANDSPNRKPEATPQMKPGGTSEAQAPTASQPAASDTQIRPAAPKSTPKTPAAAGKAPRNLPGTAWKIDFGKGVTGTVFLFCNSGKWENVLPSGRIGAVGKSYSVSGNTLTTVNADDGMTQKWQMTWEGEVLVLNDGKVSLKLHYNGETQCK